MLIKGIRISGLAPHDNVEITKLNELNIFIGANNSGKSKILNAIALIGNYGKDNVVKPPPNFVKLAASSVQWVFNAKLEEIFPDLDKIKKILEKINQQIFDLIQTEGIDFRILVDTSMRFKSDFAPQTGTFDLFKKEYYDHSSVPVVFINTITQYFKSYFEVFIKNFSPINSSIVSYIHDVRPAINSIRLPDLHDSNYPGLYNEFVQKFSGFSESFPEIDIKKSGIISILKREQKGEIVPIGFNGEGSGCKRALQILWDIFILKKIKMIDDKHKNVRPILIIDEPELSMHAGLQRQIMQVIIEASCQIQIFLSTHSPIFAKPARNSAIILFPIARKGGELKNITGENELPEVGAVLGISNEDYFGYTKMIILEGDTEVAFLNKLFHEKHIDPFIQGLKIVNMEGVGRFKNYKKNYVRQFFKTLFDLNIKVRILTDCEDPAPVTKENLERDFGGNEDGKFRWQLLPGHFEATFDHQILYEALLKHAEYDDLKINLSLKKFKEKIKTSKTKKMFKKLEDIYESNTHGALDKRLYGICLAEVVMKSDVKDKIIPLNMIEKLLNELALVIKFHE